MAAAVALTACSGGGLTRAQVVDRYRRELVSSGVAEADARCVTDRFFASLDDAQLRAFEQRDALTDAERQRFRELGDACAGTTSG